VLEVKEGKHMPDRSNATSQREFHPRSELFTVRLWWEDRGKGCVEWRGKVQHALSGETRYFRDWQVLLDFLQEARTETGINGREELPLKTQD
jgi:hypothetical protein